MALRDVQHLASLVFLHEVRLTFGQEPALDFLRSTDPMNFTAQSSDLPDASSMQSVLWTPFHLGQLTTSAKLMPSWVSSRSYG